MLTLALLLATHAAQPWSIHDMDRPLPPRVEGVKAITTPPPADAIVLFDGSDASGLSHGDGSDVKWTIRDGYMEVKGGTGQILSRQHFGDVQMHVEWLVPESESGDDGQARGNSGVFLMGRYEIQVLESTGGVTYADGMAGAMYGQFPPQVNAGAGIGKWNSYDITFRGPRFDGDTLVKPATITVLHNGVVIHANTEFTGPSGHHRQPPYAPHPDALPITFQDHGDPVRYRNIWVRPLSEEIAATP